MQNWAIEKRVKKTGGKMIYRVRIEPKNKKAPHLAGLCCAKLFFNEQLRLVGGAASQGQDCLTSHNPANREIYRVYN